MSEPFIAEIRMVGFNFAPTGWATCQGQLMAISQNTALFSLLGTFYGGDGKSNFGLPNLMASIPIHQGTGNGLTPRDVGETGGSANVTLLSTEIPLHGHTAKGTNTAGAAASLAGNDWARTPGAQTAEYRAGAPNAAMSPNALAVAGGNQPHNNLMPYQALLYIIALQGIFPARG